MRNVLGLKIESRIGLFIMILVIAIFLFTVFKSMDNFNKFTDKVINQYEKLRVEEGE